jgi:hypothetical protein
VVFQYSTSSTLASPTSTTPQNIGSGTTGQSVSASVTGLTPGTTYYYRVVATSTAGTTQGSIMSFQTLAASPSAPTNLRVTTETGPRRAILVWDAPSSGTVTSYRIERRTGSGEFATLTNVPGSILTYTDTTVQNNATYTYRVRSCAGTGSAEVCSDPSNAATVSF